MGSVDVVAQFEPIIYVVGRVTMDVKVDARAVKLVVDLLDFIVESIVGELRDGVILGALSFSLFGSSLDLCNLLTMR